MSYNLFLDDIRNPNKFLNDLRSWETVKNYNEFVKIITEKGLPNFISFDHDLATEHYPFSELDGGIGNSKKIPYESYQEKTGYDCAKWLIEYCMRTKQLIPSYQVHSMNPVGRYNILYLVDDYKNKFENID